MVRLLLAVTLLFSAFASPAAAQDFASRRITVTAQGRGPDVILIPGLASTPEIWRRTANRLDDRYRVHVVGIRGFGALPAAGNASGPIAGPVAAEIARYIRERRLNQPAVVGHSMGGQIALRLAADAPRNVGRVMVVDSSPFFPSLVDERTTAAHVRPLAEIARTAIQFLGDDALRAQGAALSESLGGSADSIFGLMGWQGGGGRVLGQSLYEIMTDDLRPGLNRVIVPVTVVYGYSSAEGSPRAVVDQAFRSGYRALVIPARYERIDGAQHMVMVDQPRRFDAALDRFLE